MTVALTTGLGCGILIGFLLAGRRRSYRLTESHTSGKSFLTVRKVEGEYKMVFVVRNDLKMGKGKIAAQCGHAAIGAYKQLMETNPEVISHWENRGCTKVVVKAPDEEAFAQTMADASSLGLNTHVVRDAGRTQIAPGSKTVLCVGPGPVDKVDIATGHLKLL